LLCIAELDLGAKAVARGAACCASQVLDRGAQAAARERKGGKEEKCGQRKNVATNGGLHKRGKKKTRIFK
jgi:hypothetical protein